MPNTPFLEPNVVTIPGYPIKEIGDYSSVNSLELVGTTPQEITGESTITQFATFSSTGADIYVLTENQTSISASPTNYSFILGDGDNFVDFRIGRQRLTCCADVGESATLKVAIAQEEIIII